ncbi:8-oxoguanine deaminase [Actinophytocola algeriensis]|uniref:Cytosine/adenosine deaminase-related metal-dependent hydrolase n=1 Tax=Actinophytocola algeriensis TaxID=1768010 RepID=A0A7W7QAP7_9PSEU|nr:8-oxoguanine deaminase [Actinophytocola algeriensis]MBB4909978.1 cytosine/adenosine deaminase-related metal-dependent hydrolase [Actinophytocola algeriensis]MBE1475968.1 cytosine/adenosine deaminase-related metal-dependent hydrolase [Actinophytocola algeriensis]
MRTIIENAAIATVDGGEGAGTEYRYGHVVVTDGIIEAVGDGAAPPGPAADRWIDGTGCLVTPGFVNTHHHLYQWATRGYAQDATLYEWLTALYPVWAGIDETIVHTAAVAGLTRLARTGCTTAADHHYVIPRNAGDTFGATVEAARTVGIRLHGVRGSMDRGESQGGLPPDSIVETLDGALTGTAAAIDAFHDPSPGSFTRIAVGPCSPFSVSEDLMRKATELARDKGVRLHTHLAETLDEERQCLDEYGCTPAELADRLDWLGEDVWFAHGIHFSDDAVARLGATGTGVAHCPTSNSRLGAGIARVQDLVHAGCPVGLGVDGAASNEDGGLGIELRQAVYLARQKNGPHSATARDGLWLATRGGARVLGREAEIGSLEAGKQADLAVWRLTGMNHAGITDPVAALVFGALPPLALLLAGGNVIVEDDEVRTVSEADAATALGAASRALAEKS